MEAIGLARAPGRAASRTTILAFLLAVCGASLPAQVSTPAIRGSSPAFDVASIKENGNPDGPRLFSPQPDGGITIVNQTLRQLIYSAYQTQDYRIIGGPDWLNTVRFDISAKAAPDTPLPQRLAMLRTLLATRFNLVMRAETRELPVYTLTMARSDGRPGPELKPSACVVAAPNAPPAAGTTPCGNRNAPGIIASGGSTTDALANQLGRLAQIGRPVVNRTNLAGTFDYELRFDPNQAAADPSDRVSIFTALQEQLGMTLRSSRGPVDVLVIDSVSRPTPN